jgi:hypothetical protein
VSSSNKHDYLKPGLKNDELACIRVKHIASKVVQFKVLEELQVRTFLVQFTYSTSNLPPGACWFDGLGGGFSGHFLV